VDELHRCANCDHFAPGRLARFIEVLGANWIGVLFLLLVTLLAVDAITLFGLLLPRFAVKLRAWALTAGGVLCVIAFAQGLRAPVVQNYEIRLAGLPPESDGTVLVLGPRMRLWRRGEIVRITLRAPQNG